MSAEGVREALAAVIEANLTWKRRMGDGYTSSGYNDGGDIADAILADPRFDVRLRGPVTDAEVGAVRDAISDEFHGLSYRERLIVRAALEAAREVRP